MYITSTPTHLIVWRAKLERKKMAKNWAAIIEGLQKLLAEVGPIWPKSTKLAGFAADGPYHCTNCEYLSADKTRCKQSVMMADPEVKHDEKGLAVITDAEHQCCEFVEPLVQIEGEEFGAAYKWRSRK